jgi:hypothetical protein
MSEFKFLIEDYFNLSRPDGASKAFAGKLLKGSISIGDNGISNFEKNIFNLKVLGCEKGIRQPVSSLDAPNDLCAIAVSIEENDQLKELLRKKGWGVLRGATINSN